MWPENQRKCNKPERACYSEPMFLHFAGDPRRHYRRLLCGVASDTTWESWQQRKASRKNGKVSLNADGCSVGRRRPAGSSRRHGCVPETSAGLPPLRVSLSQRRGHLERLQVDGSHVWGRPVSQGGPQGSRDGMCPRLAPRPWGWRPLSLVPLMKGN